ncbi:MAG TPA: molybdate ABC transporter substrate-binding protein [Planctomycetota bacterium]|nr:molybdate ABC transporter substrate-binding protein [Planctomycetota bacterium]
MLRRLYPGHINSAWLAFVGSIGLLAVLIGLLAWPAQKESSKSPLLVYCAAGLKAPVEAVAKEYEKEFGVPIHLNFGGSQTLLADVEVSKRGDLYLPADGSYLDMAGKKGLIAEVIPLATMNVILAVKEGNPKNINALGDLLKDGVKLAQVNPDAAAVGKLTRQKMESLGQWDALKKHTTVFKGTVSDVASDLRIGSADAGFVWDAFLVQYTGLQKIPLPELDDVSAKMSIAVLKSSANASAALSFARYLGARDKGLKHFERNGFKPVEGDQWAITPEIRLMAGAMLRPAIEETISAFEKREGCRVTRVYNGCGILVAQMRAGQKADAYFACDQSFMDQVSDLFLDSSEISENKLVIIVKKGNPRKIHRLRDLGQPNLKVGVGHEKQCALGALTKTTLEAAGRYNIVAKNVTVQSPTGDMLVNQLLTGSLDAVIAYVSNAAAAKDQLETVDIDVECATAVQPFAIGKDSVNAQITQRLLDAIKSAESEERFRKNGFTWQAGAKE